MVEVVPYSYVTFNVTSPDEIFKLALKIDTVCGTNSMVCEFTLCTKFGPKPKKTFWDQLFCKEHDVWLKTSIRLQKSDTKYELKEGVDSEEECC